MGQAKNRGSLEERVQNAKKLNIDEILKELQRLIEGHYQHVPSQFSHHHNYLDGCVIAMDTKDAMDIALDNDDLGIFEDGYPHPEYISGFSVHDKFHRTLILSGFCLLKIAKISLNSSFFPKPIKR